MNEMPTKLQARAARKTAKRDEKKRQIAESAIEALKELGYANTSLRDIAAKSDLSLGMLHYYFEDRSDLIIYCVKSYKRSFVADVTRAMKDAEGREAVIETLSEAFVVSIFDDEMVHRLWYDIRNQAMFDETFRPVVAEIEGMLVGVIQTAFDKAGTNDAQPVELCYASVDGVFRYFMQGQFGANPLGREEMLDLFRKLLADVI